MAGEPTLVIGGPVRLRGGALVLARKDRWAAEDALIALVGEAIETAARDRLLPVAFYVPHQQLVGFADGWKGRHRRTAAGVWSQIEVRVDSAGHMQHPDKKVRELWKSDERRATAAGLALAVEPVTTELIRVAAPLADAVIRRNGAATHPRIVEHRLRIWHEFDPRSAVAFVARDASAALLGVTFARSGGEAVELYDIGMVEDAADRRTLYSALAFVAPFSYARDHGLSRIELGVGHAYPKSLHGASQEPLWHVAPAVEP